MAAVFDKPMAAIDDRVTMVCDALARELAVLFLCSWYHGVSVFSGTWVNLTRAFRALRSIEMRASSFTSALCGRTLTAPAGFVTDFCSVPRVRVAFALLGDRAQVGHHPRLLYTSHEVDRETADKVLWEMLLLNGVDALEAEAFYAGVWLGGGSHWVLPPHSR